MNIFRQVRFLIYGAVLIVAVACATAGNLAAAQWNPELTRIIEGAENEGRLNLMWGSTTLNGSEGAKMFQAEMNKMFGTSIQIIFTPGPAMARVGSQVATEYAAGQSAVTDVYLATAVQITPLLSRQIFEPVDWPKLLPQRITSKMVEGNSTALRFSTALSGVTYNSKLIPRGKVPDSLKDFLKPEWKGKIASTPYAASFDSLVAEEMWGPDKALDYVKRLSGQIAGLMRCGEEERLLTGEFLALVMDCGGQYAALWKEKGAPLDQMVPKDAAQKRYYYLTVPKNAAHSNAAKLFSIFMMTEKGQKLAWKTWKTDLHFMPETNMRQKIDFLEKKGLKFFENTIEWLQKNPEVTKTKRKMVKILRGK